MSSFKKKNLNVRGTGGKTAKASKESARKLQKASRKRAKWKKNFFLTTKSKDKRAGAGGGGATNGIIRDSAVEKQIRSRPS